MNKEAFLFLLDDLFEEPQGTLQGDEVLLNIELWDSLTALGFIALVDEEFNVVISGTDIEQCETINDLIDLATQFIKE